MLVLWKWKVIIIDPFIALFKGIYRRDLKKKEVLEVLSICYFLIIWGILLLVVILMLRDQIIWIYYPEIYHRYEVPPEVKFFYFSDKGFVRYHIRKARSKYPPDW